MSRSTVGAMPPPTSRGKRDIEVCIQHAYVEPHAKAHVLCSIAQCSTLKDTNKRKQNSKMFSNTTPKDPYVFAKNNQRNQRNKARSQSKRAWLYQSVEISSPSPETYVQGRSIYLQVKTEAAVSDLHRWCQLPEEKATEDLTESTMLSSCLHSSFAARTSHQNSNCSPDIKFKWEFYKGSANK